MDDVHLYPLSLSVDNSDLLKALLLTFKEIVLQKRRDLLGREGVKINPVLNGNLNRHKESFKFKVNRSCSSLRKGGDLEFRV